MSYLKKVISCALAIVLMLGVMAPEATASSSSEIRKQINALKEEKEALQEKISQVRDQYSENEDEIADIIAQKSATDQEIQLLSEQIENINQQISAYNTLIADKQDELDYAEGQYEQLSSENMLRIRTMEEEGEISYWEIIFNANSFSNLLDRLTMVEEIASSDKRRLQKLADAADNVALAQQELEIEKKEMELTKQELDATQVELDAKVQESVDLLQELLSKSDELTELQEEYEAMEAEFLEEIAKMESQYSAAKQAEWEAWIATSIPSSPTVGNVNGNNSESDPGSSSSNNTSAWLIPVNYTSITSPFGYREAPTAGASTNHQGVDLDTGTGDPVVASRAGIVTAGYSNSAGNYVSINHQDGFSSIYMHLTNYCVSTGQVVSAGQVIGYTGSTGIANGDHLHFGISYQGVFVNPCNYVPLY